MSLSLGINISALVSQRALATVRADLGLTFERLSSGQRINRAADDAAGLSVASRLQADRRIFNQAVRNLNDGISALSIADQGISQLVDIVTRQLELAEQSANGIFSVQQRSVLDQEAQSLALEYRRLLDTTSFNGLSLLNGSISTLHLQAGYGSQAVLAAQFFIQTSTQLSELQGLGTYVNGDDTLNLQVSGSSPLTEAEIVAGDFNGDGYDDIVVFDEFFDGSSQVTIELYHGSESGLSLQAREVMSLPAGSLVNFQAEVVGDSVEFTANGGFEGTVFSLNNPGFFFALGGGGITVDDPQNFTFSTGTYDFNGDGFTDRITGDVGTVLVELQDTNLEVSTVVTTESLTQEAFSLLTDEASRSALEMGYRLLDLLNDKRSQLGASQSRIATSIEVLRATEENYASAESRIIDADIAQESAAQVRLSILQQTAAAVLAQASQQPQLALSLLQ